MKYSHQIEINRPIDKIIELFDNPDNMKHWQKGFTGIEPLSVSPGQVGTKSKLM